MSRDTSNTPVLAGSIAGASGDGGVEYRRAVAAYAVAYGLSGVPLRGFGVPPENARVRAVSLETDDPVDDIRIDFDDGWMSLVQAKRTLRKGPQLDKALAQWVDAARSGLRPDRHRLVIVTGSLSGPVEDLQRALERWKTETPGGLTGREQEALAYLDARLEGLDEGQRALVRRCASIHKLEVEEEHFADAREGALLLSHIVRPEHVAEAWSKLIGLAGVTARRRGGFGVSGWLDEMRGAGVEIDSSGSSMAAQLERRHIAVTRYLEIVRRRGRCVDLRGLGAAVAPIPIEKIDAKVMRVLTDQEDARSDADLLWAFLRRGRTVLTGLPGGGKSTSLTILAAQLADYADVSLPVLVSLKDVDALDRSSGFRERLITAALRDLGEADRRLVGDEIDTRLREGRLTLLLDSLDETYRRRAAVVAEIDALLASCSPDIDVLLATRDVAYAQAATLGWPDLRLVAPGELGRMIDAILRRGADQRLGSATGLAEDGVDAWVADRRAWVGNALSADATLRETPLLPTLLTLLAIERDTAALPKGRARVLEAVVNDVVARQEANRRGEFALGALQGEAAAQLALQVFASEAAAIVAEAGHCSFTRLVDRLGKQVEDEWGLSAGQARVAAEAAVRLWDESGIFVISGATETVAARVALFAEIGDAIAATGRADGELRTWVSDTAARGSVEALVLAAGLSEVAAGQLATLAAASHDRSLLHAAARALREGATLAPTSFELVVSGLLDDIARGDREAWESWSIVFRLPPEMLDPQALVDALAAFPLEHQRVGRARVELRWRDRAQLQRDPQTLLNVLAVKRLPRLRRRAEEAKRDWQGLVVDAGLVEAVSGAAEALVGAVPGAEDLVVGQLKATSYGLQKRLVTLLRSRGFGTRADEALADQQSKLLKAFGALGDYDPDAHRKLLSSLASRPRAPLDYKERVRLDELADLVETLNLNDGSSWMGRAREDRFDEVLDLVALLGSFDLGVVAAQAAVVLDRMTRSGDGHGAFFALFDGASSRGLTNWATVADHEAALDLLIEMLYWTRGNAIVAAQALWGAPVVDFAAPRLRAALPDLAVSTEHERIAAHALCSMVDGPEPAVWIDQDDPVLRAVAAEWCEAAIDGRLSPPLHRLLEDDDGCVRAAALRCVYRVEADDRDEAFARVAAAPDPGWMCLSCRTVNPRGTSSCRKPDCHRAAPRPSADAARMLEGTFRED